MKSMKSMKSMKIKFLSQKKINNEKYENYENYKFIDNKFYTLIKLLSQHYERGKICYHVRMKIHFYLLKKYIYFIKDIEVKKEYTAIYKILQSVYTNKNVSDRKKALYGKTLLRLLNK